MSHGLKRENSFGIEYSFKNCQVVPRVKKCRGKSAQVFKDSRTNPRVIHLGFQF